MLHKINPPDCQEQMDWIVHLQRRLLTALCHPDMTSDQVTVEWVINELRDLHLDKRWIKRFCQVTDEIPSIREPMIKHMYTLANLDPSLKNQLLETFENDLLFLKNFPDQPTQGHQLIGHALIEKQPQKVQNAVRGFFESFYHPNFMTNVGYRIWKQDGTKEHFHRSAFLAYYQQNNVSVVVCPACDGAMSNSDVDHFYPKSKFPFLSCTLLNLVPICPDCNRGANGKHSKIPLTLNTPHQTDDWFHPYLRPIHGTYELKPVHTEKGVTFALYSKDTQAQKCLDNYQSLFGVQERWHIALARSVSITKAMVKDLRKEQDKMSQEELIDEILLRTKICMYERGREPFAIIKCAYLDSLSKKDSLTFEEIWRAYTGVDSVMGTEY